MSGWGRRRRRTSRSWGELTSGAHVRLVSSLYYPLRINSLRPPLCLDRNYACFALLDAAYAASAATAASPLLSALRWALPDA